VKDQINVYFVAKKSLRYQMGNQNREI